MREICTEFQRILMFLTCNILLHVKKDYLMRRTLKRFFSFVNIKIRSKSFTYDSNDSAFYRTCLKISRKWGIFLMLFPRWFILWPGHELYVSINLNWFKYLIFLVLNLGNSITFHMGRVLLIMDLIEVIPNPLYGVKKKMVGINWFNLLWCTQFWENEKIVKFIKTKCRYHPKISFLNKY